MTTSIRSEAMWNIKKYVWTSENCIKIKENKKITKPFNNFKLNTFTFMSFVAKPKENGQNIYRIAPHS